ncbi:MAG: AbrB/MazE/SpoVT family DNA-binding domain-containing protein [Gammaproteobacteria bacterium]
MTVKGQVTIPKRIRDTLKLEPGSRVEFDVNPEGQIIVHKAGGRRHVQNDRFAAVRGKAQLKWRTDELMALLREAD